MSDAFDAALDAIYEDPNTGSDVVFTPLGGAAVALRGLVAMGDQVTQFEVVGNMVMTPRNVRIRVSELTDKAPGVTPQRGDGVAAAGLDLVVTGTPDKRDARRKQWTLELAST